MTSDDSFVLPSELVSLMAEISHHLPGRPDLRAEILAGADLSRVWPRFVLWLLEGHDSPIQAEARQQGSDICTLYRELVDGHLPTLLRSAPVDVAEDDDVSAATIADMAARMAIGTQWEARKMKRMTEAETRVAQARVAEEVWMVMRNKVLELMRDQQNPADANANANANANATVPRPEDPMTQPAIDLQALIRAPFGLPALDPSPPAEPSAPTEIDRLEMGLHEALGDASAQAALLVGHVQRLHALARRALACRTPAERETVRFELERLV